jgi:hypothetical protein
MVSMSQSKQIILIISIAHWIIHYWNVIVAYKSYAMPIPYQDFCDYVLPVFWCCDFWDKLM